MESTVGVAQSGEQTRWVRYQFDQGGHRFACGELNYQPDTEALHAVPRLTALGIDAADVVFRTTSFPFEKSEQIRQVLPQEAMESLIYRPDHPHLAFVQSSNGEGESAIFYGVADLQHLEEAIQRYTAQAVRGSRYWVTEAGSWPLLQLTKTISDQERVLIVDQSAVPASLLWVEQGKLQALRIVSEAANSAGQTVVQKELQWMINDQLRQSVELPDKVILLNVSFAPQLPEESETTALVTPQLSELIDGTEEWGFIRPAGMAVAMADEKLSDRMLDFCSGRLAGEINWKNWLAPWRAAAAVLLAISITGVAHQSLRYSDLNGRSAQLTQQMKEQFQKTLPQVPMVDPVAQLKQAYQKIAGDSERPVRPLGQWIALIQTQIPEESSVQWKQLLYDNGQLQLVGEVPSYDHLDKVQAALKIADGVESVEMEKAQILSKSRHVQFNLKVM